MQCSNIFSVLEKIKPLNPVFYIEILNIFLKDFIYLFLERWEEREKEGEKHQCVVASQAPPTRDLACNPGMCPD